MVMSPCFYLVHQGMLFGTDSGSGESVNCSAHRNMRAIGLGTAMAQSSQRSTCRSIFGAMLALMPILPNKLVVADGLWCDTHV